MGYRVLSNRYFKAVFILLMLTVIISSSAYLFLPSLSTLDYPQDSEPIAGGGPTPTPSNESPGDLLIYAHSEERQIQPHENALIKVGVVNLYTNENATTLHFVVKSKPGVSPLNSSNKSVRLEPGDEKEWSIPVRLTQGYHEITVNFYYDFENSESKSYNESKKVRFFMPENHSTSSPNTDNESNLSLLEPLFSFGLVTTFMAIYINIIDNIVSLESDKDIYDFLMLSVAIGAPSGFYKDGRLILETGIGTGLLIMVIIPIALVAVKKLRRKMGELIEWIVNLAGK